MKALPILLSAALMVAACTPPKPLAPSNGPWRFSGTISRLDGDRLAGPIAGASLVVQDGPDVDVKATTDGAGRFAFAALESGRFSVAIAASGYVGVTPVVHLFQNTEANFALLPQ